MKFLNKKETVIQNLTFIAIMAAINVILVTLNVFIPLLGIVLMLVLPLVSAVASIYTKNRYYPIYLVVTLTISLLIGINNIGDVINYLLPSLLTGFIFGKLIDKKIHFIFIILISSLIQFVCSISAIYIIYGITGLNYFDTIINLFNLNENTYKTLIPLSFILVVSIAQMVLSFFIIKEEIKKLGIEVKMNFTNLDKNIFLISDGISLILTIIFAFIYLPISYLFFSLFILFSLIVIIDGFLRRIKWIYIASFISIFISLMLFGAIYPHIKEEYALLLMGIYWLMGSLPSIIHFSFNNYLKKDVNM